MGWCQAFGPQIRAGCDHAMVANADSCSCPECNVVCPGKFPGCSAVWAEGPQYGNVRRPGGSIDRPHGLPAVAPTTRGQLTENATDDTPPMRALRSPPSTDTQSDLRPVLNALRVEIQALRRKIDQIGPTQPTSRLAEQALEAIEALPNKVAKVALQAMRTQHEAFLRDLQDYWERIQKSSKPDEASNPPGTPVTVDHLDARFTWLVTELSDRLVIVGNEIARIDKQLATGNNGAGGATGHSDKAPIRTEVSRTT